MKRILLFASLALVTTVSAYGTTLLVKLDGDRIYVAADNREEFIDPERTAVNDHTCKIHSYGNTVTAFTGDWWHWTAPNSYSARTTDWDAFADSPHRIRRD